MAPNLSLTQLSYTAAGLLSVPASRLDGRSLLAFRPMRLTTGVSAQAAGSALCSLAGGSTRCLAVVSAEVAQEEEAMHADGRALIECSVDLDAGIASSANLAALMLTLQGALINLLSSTAILDPEQLVILRSPYAPHRPTRAWRLIVDVTLVDVAGGNVADTMMAAVHAALNDVRLPRTGAIGFDVQGAAAQGSSAQMDIFDVRGSLARTRGAVKGKAQQQPTAAASIDGTAYAAKMGVDFDVLDSQEATLSLDGVHDFPLGVTVSVLADGHLLLDAAQTEEACIPFTRRMLVLSGARSGRVFGTHMLTASMETGAHQLGEERGISSTTPSLGGGTCDYKTVQHVVHQGQLFAKQLHAVVEQQLSYGGDTPMQAAA